MTSAQKTLRLVTSREEARRDVTRAKAEGEKIGLVPTMGGLHGGHLSLVKASTSECSFNVASIFVNPTQFGPSEDFNNYPRPFESDLEALALLGVDLVFAPKREEMYPEGLSTSVEPPDVAKGLEGECRPGHFHGVATIVLKLFNIIPADVAFFGEKDFQQLLVIRRMVEDLNVPIAIRGCPIVRESDGIASSTRNGYLSPTERKQSLAISRSLLLARELVVSGERDSAALRKNMREEIGRAGISRIDYIAIADPETLEPIDCVDGPARVLVAAYVGDTRLIDNCQIG